MKKVCDEIKKNENACVFLFENFIISRFYLTRHILCFANNFQLIYFDKKIKSFVWLYAFLNHYIEFIMQSFDQELNDIFRESIIT